MADPTAIGTGTLLADTATASAPVDGSRAADRIAIVILLIVASLFAVASQDPASAGLFRGCALVTLLIGLVATKAVPDQVAALMFFAVAVTMAAIPPKVAFSGFFAGAAWLILAGSVLGAVLNETGLAQRIVATIVRPIGRSYASVIAVLAAMTVILQFLIPSTAGRIMILLPLIVALSGQLGFKAGSRGYLGIVVTVTALSNIASAGVLTSTSHNLALVGTAQALYEISFGYTDFLRLNFPVLTLLSTAVFCGLVIWRYHEPFDAVVPAADAGRTPISGSERCVLAITLAAIALWATDFLHGVSPAWVGLGAAVLCIAGPCRTLAVPDRKGFCAWILVAAFVSLGAVISHTGLARELGGALVAVAGLAPGDSFGATAWNLAAITAICVVVNLIATNLGAPVVLAALAQPIGAATGWPVETVLVIMLASWSICPLAYQAPVLLVAMRMANAPTRELNISLLLMAAVTLIVLLPLQFAWLWAIGALG